MIKWRVVHLHPIHTRLMHVATFHDPSIMLLIIWFIGTSGPGPGEVFLVITSWLHITARSSVERDHMAPVSIEIAAEPDQCLVVLLALLLPFLERCLRHLDLARFLKAQCLQRYKQNTFDQPFCLLITAHERKARRNDQTFCLITYLYNLLCCRQINERNSKQITTGQVKKHCRDELL